MYNYYNAQLDIAKELFAKTQYDAAISILTNELTSVEESKDFLLLSEYLHIIIFSYIHKSDIEAVEPLLEQLNNALIQSNHPLLKISYPYHVGCFFYLSGDLVLAIEMFEKAFTYIENNRTHPYYLSICTALCSWYLTLHDYKKAFYYRDQCLSKIYLIKHQSPLSFGYFMNVHAHCLMIQEEWGAAYEALNKVWEHPILMKDAKIFIITACNFGIYYNAQKEFQLADAYFKKSWASLKSSKDLQFKLLLLTNIIDSHENAKRFKEAFSSAKIKMEILDSQVIHQQQKRLHQFALQAKQDAMNLVAYIDKVTQIYNRHYFEEHFTRWLLLAEQTKSPLCCALFDIDNFKTLNDTYGHLLGDQILQVVGAVVKKHEVPDELFTARYGGDEFIIVSNNPDLFKYTINLLFQELQGLEIPHQDQLLTFTISLGAIVVDDVTDYSVADFLRQADEQLYAVKRSGKNDRYITYTTIR